MATEPYYVFDPDQHPDLAHVRDRTEHDLTVERVLYGEGDLTQAADVVEAQTREANARRAIGDMVARDGDRQSGCALIVDTEAGTVTITDGTIYLLGKPRPIAGAVLSDVPMEGTVDIGVFVTETIITAEDDGQYYGLVEGTASYGETGAIRTRLALAWGMFGDGSSGEFYHFSNLVDGIEIASQAPTSLSGVQKQIGLFDLDRSGNYVVRGMDVTAVSLEDDALTLSIAAGTANVLGSKIIKNTDSRLVIDADPDVAHVTSEPQTYVDNGGSATVRVNHPPIAAISSVIVTKERTVTLTKGAGGDVDDLPNSSVASIRSVVQGTTTFVTGDDYVLTADGVDWSPAGAEPTSGSSYDVTYWYLDEVAVDSFTLTDIVVSGGVDAQPMFLAYDYKVPRWDRLLLQQDGTFAYLKGTPSPTNPRAPVEPVSALSIAILKQDWFDVPSIEGQEKRLDAQDQIDLRRRVNDLALLIGQNRLTSLASGRNTGKTLGIFVDPFNDDSYRDAGEEQDAAVVPGSLQLAIDVTVLDISQNADIMLNYSSKVAIEQPLVTGCVKINEYQNFNPPPAKMVLSPARDFWTIYDTDRLSTETTVIGSGNQSRVTSSSTKTTVTTTKLSKLRQIDVNFTISGLGAGEALEELTFDGIDVTPEGLVANASGVLTGSFEIPAGVSAGIKAVRAVMGSGSKSGANFEGQGYYQKTTIQEFVTIRRTQQATTRSVGGQGGGSDSSNDPQAQSFVHTEGRHTSGVALKFCSIGDRSKPVIIEVVTVTEDFYPSQEVVAQQWLDMNAVQTGVWTNVLFDLPPYQPEGTYYAFVVKTDDADHSVSIARLKDFDAVEQKWVTSQPYTAGDRFDGSNGKSWQLWPDSDLTFRILSPKFEPTQKTVPLGTYAVDNVSDLQIVADVLLPEADCSVFFRVVVGSQTFTVETGQTIELSDFYTGNVTVTAVLSGNERASPILFRDIQMLLGTLRTTGTYIGLVWTMGDVVDLQGSLATKVPAGSSLLVYVDANDDNWTLVEQVDAAAIDDGFTERFYGLADHEAPNGGRIRIDMTGTPAARPSVCDLNFSVGA